MYLNEQPSQRVNKERLASNPLLDPPDLESIQQANQMINRIGNTEGNKEEVAEDPTTTRKAIG